jgi:hypothetical protein
MGSLFEKNIYAKDITFEEVLNNGIKIIKI